MIDKIKRAQGCLIGAAAGDALGMPSEYISKAQLNQFYDGKITQFQKPLSNHPCRHLQKGQYTDDTQRLIVLAESLISCHGFDVNDFGRRVGEWAFKCMTIPHYDRFAGTTSIMAGLKLYDRKRPDQTGGSAPTCGSAMGIAPLGVFYHQQIDALNNMARVNSKVTHRHPAAIDAALLVSHLVAYFMNGLSVEQALQQTRTRLTSDLVYNLDFITLNKERQPAEMAVILGASEKAHEAVPLALHCFLHSPDNYEQTIINAANLVSGDTDSIACIAGALSGAYNGIDTIPKKFKEGLEDVNLLGDLAARLIQTSPTN